MRSFGRQPTARNYSESGMEKADGLDLAEQNGCLSVVKGSAALEWPAVSWTWPSIPPAATNHSFLQLRPSTQNWIGNKIEASMQSQVMFSLESRPN